VILAGAILTIATCTSAKDGVLISVGAAKVDITPTTPVVLAGYGGRTKPYESIDTKLWARAMVIGDEKPVAVVALDNCGVPRVVSDRLAKRLAKHDISRERLVVAATHTHNAPTLTGYAPILWQGRTTPEQDRLTADYTTFAIQQMEQAVVKAMENRERMRLEWAQGRVTFGGNRRVIRSGRWAGFGFQRKGPVDHSLPVLAARDAKGIIRAVWTNYACHCTTVGSRNAVGGDWAGYANVWMEKEFTEAVSLMTIGCGADVGPQPSGNLAIADQHGKSVATEVKRLLSGETTQLDENPVVTSRTIKLPLTKPKPREYWEPRARADGFHAQLAKLMLRRIDETGAVPSEVDYPISVWQFGDDLAMIFLAGEVVVDYSVRLKHELDWKRLWITAWANDVPGYIPSRRVLAEGGYEADFSQVYYGLPGTYNMQVEDIVVDAVTALVGRKFAPAADQPTAPFHRLPSADTLAFVRLAKWVAAEKAGDESAIYKKLEEYAPLAQPGFERVTQNDGEATEWHNFAGDFAARSFIRQEKRGVTLSWTSPRINDKRPAVLCFCGGVGWQSQPKTEGFALTVSGGEQLKFDVTRTPSRWESASGDIELLYLPTWTSNVDSGGFYFLVVHKPQLNDDGRILVSVRSLGEGSKRWFAIDSKQQMSSRLKKLVTAFERKHDGGLN
jgi:hypothetical protein